MLRVCPCTKFEGRSDPPYGSTCTLHAPEMMTEVFLPFGAVKVVRIVSDSRGKLPAWLTVRGRDVHMLLPMTPAALQPRPPVTSSAHHLLNGDLILGSGNDAIPPSPRLCPAVVSSPIPRSSPISPFCLLRLGAPTPPSSTHLLSLRPRMLR